MPPLPLPPEVQFKCSYYNNLVASRGYISYSFICYNYIYKMPLDFLTYQRFFTLYIFKNVNTNLEVFLITELFYKSWE